MSNLSKLKKSKITLGVTPITFKFIEKSLMIFCSRFSNADIKIIEAHNDAKLLEMLGDGEVDLIFYLHTSPVINEKFHYENLDIKRLFLAVCKSHPLVSKAFLHSNEKYPKISLKDFENEKFILSNHNTRVQSGFEKIFKNAGFSPNVFCVTDSLDTTASLVSMGFGMGFVFENYIDDRNKDFITLLDIKDENLLDIKISGIYKKSSKLIKEFIKLLKNNE